MPQLLRDVRQNRWFKEVAAPFLAIDDVPADPIGDLRTQENRLSVFEVTEDGTNIERIIRALAIGKDKIADTGYVVFDAGLLPTAGIDILETPGKTADEGANAWHRDLIVSGNKLIALTKAILRHGKSGTVLKVRLRELIEEGARNGEIPEKFRTKFCASRHSANI